MLSLGGILCCWSEFEYIKETWGKRERGVQHSLCSPGPLCGKRGRLPYDFFSFPSPTMALFSTTNLAYYGLQLCHEHILKNPVLYLPTSHQTLYSKCYMCCSSMLVNLVLMKVSVPPQKSPTDTLNRSKRSVVPTKGARRQFISLPPSQLDISTNWPSGEKQD